MRWLVLILSVLLASCSGKSSGNGGTDDCGTILHGQQETRRCYDALFVQQGETCAFTDQTRTCDDGRWNPDWPACDYPTCVVLGPTINAASCSQPDVQAAIDAAGEGDTVVVPAGNCTWTVTVVIEDKALILQGAGAGQTVIEDAVDGDWCGNYPCVALAVVGVEGKPVRITGFSFEGESHNHGTIHIRGTCKSFRLDHLELNLTGGHSIETIGETYGVIDNCNFGTLSTAVGGLVIKGSYPGDAAWQSDLNLGTGNAVYVEDCTFNFVNVNDTHAAIDCQSGGRFVFRHNVINNGFVGNHGTESGCPERSCRSYEIYGNTLTHGSNFARAVFIRGGNGVIYDNQTTGFQRIIDMNYYRVCLPDRPEYQDCPDGDPWYACDGNSHYDGNQNANGWPCYDQHGRGRDVSATQVHPQAEEPIYEWENYLDGQEADITLGCTELGDYLREGTEYVSNTPMPGYTAYTYPHPLTASMP